MTSLPVRQNYVEWLTEAITNGARKKPACGELGISLRTFQRWTQENTMKPDGRTTAIRPVPANALTKAERQAILELCNSEEFAHLPPSQIVPRLADQGRYVGSESSFYRVLHAADQQYRRGRSQPPRRHPAPTTHVATKPNQVWSWDITYLPSPVRGQYYYLYLIEDIYSRSSSSGSVVGPVLTPMGLLMPRMNSTWAPPGWRVRSPIQSMCAEQSYQSPVRLSWRVKACS